MELDKLKQNWEIFAQTHPIWAILTVPEKIGKRWSAEDLFLSGEDEINRVLQSRRRFWFYLRASYRPRFWLWNRTTHSGTL
jgi:hypothetical protein